MYRVSSRIIGSGLLLVAIGCGGGAATPEAAFKDFQAAVKAKDGNKAWDLLSKQSQGAMDKMASAMKEQFKKIDQLPPEQAKMADEQVKAMFGMTFAELKTMDGKGMLNFSLKNADKFAKGGRDPFADIASSTLEELKVEGDKASAKVKTGTKSEPISFVKEGGSWKISMPMPGAE